MSLKNYDTFPRSKRARRKSKRAVSYSCVYLGCNGNCYNLPVTLFANVELNRINVLASLLNMTWHDFHSSLMSKDLSYIMKTARCCRSRSVVCLPCFRAKIRVINEKLSLVECVCIYLVWEQTFAHLLSHAFSP